LRIEEIKVRQLKQLDYLERCHNCCFTMDNYMNIHGDKSLASMDIEFLGENLSYTGMVHPFIL
jgi:hypothetical protein